MNLQMNKKAGCYSFVGFFAALLLFPLKKQENSADVAVAAAVIVSVIVIDLSSQSFSFLFHSSNH